MRWKFKVINDRKPSCCTMSSRFCKFFVITIIFSCIYIVIFTINHKPATSIIKNATSTQPLHKLEEKYSIKTTGCHIPAMEPINKMIEKYIFQPKINPCPNSSYPFLIQNRSHIWISDDLGTLRHYNIKERKYLKCCYSPFYRPNSISDIYSRYIDDRIVYKDCILFLNSIKVKHEYVRVTCSYKAVVMYEKYFIFVPFKKRFTNDNGDDEIEDENDTEKLAYNVLVVGIDNLSRLNSHRTMPKTLKFMKERGAIELMGYNKVGYHTYPNMIPLLLGHKDNEIKGICLPMKMTTFDDCPFLWHWYKDAGYYTAFGEDSEGTFNFERKGFRKMPTDYYAHPFMGEAVRYASKTRRGDDFLCMKENYLHNIFLDYILAITEKLFDFKLFGFFWATSVTHDSLNHPAMMDDGYLQLFERLESSNYLNKTILFLISDHGMRWGPFRRTKQGYLEERLPLAYILTPESFRNNFAEAFYNLKHNSRQLTTPLDVHRTLRDLVDLENIRDENIVARSRTIVNKRGISLFLKIPDDRTCRSAGIPNHFCACHKTVDISTSSKEAKEASVRLVDNLNELVGQYRKCAALELEEIIDAEEVIADMSKEKVVIGGKWRELSVTVKVQPSEGVFQGTLRLHENDWSVVGTVSRLNLYRYQSYCVQDPHLQLYCYCIGTD